MKRQRNTTQMKEQTRNIEVQINEEEIGKLLGKEFRTMIVKIIKNLESKMQESVNKYLKELKNKYADTNNTITELKILWKETIPEYLKQKIESVSWRMVEMVEINSEEQNKVKRMKGTEDSLRDLWDNIKYTNI